MSSSTRRGRWTAHSMTTTKPTALEAVPAVVHGHHRGLVAPRLDAVDDWFGVGGHRSVAGQVGVLHVVSDA